MKIREEINKMTDVVENLVISKFLDCDIKGEDITLISDDKIRINITLKERDKNRDKSRNSDKSSHIKYIVEKNLITANVVETEHWSSSFGSNDSTKFKIEIKIPNVYSFLMCAEKRKLQDKINEFFEYKLNEKDFKNLKYVIDNQLDTTTMRKIKLQELNKDDND